MSVKHIVRVTAVGSLAAASVLAGAGCGSSDSTSSSSGASAGAKPATADDVAGAKRVIAPFIGKPSAFPVDEPLPKPLPAGTRIGFLQCVTPVCGVFAQSLAGATRAIGAKLEIVKAGASADALQTAMSSLIEKQPDGLVLPGIEPDSIAKQLAQAKQKRIAMTSNGIMDAEKLGIGGQTTGRPAAELAGKLLAAWTVNRKGAKADIVFYNTPELSFAGPLKDGFTREIKRLCGSCETRYVDLPVGTIGNTAPSKVVSDLQSHLKTNVAAFAVSEASTGLPPALKTAGLKVDTIGFAPGPGGLQDIKSGGITAGLAADLGVTTWTLVDELARVITKTPLTKGERSTVPPLQILEAKDLQFDVSKGWSGYPDFAQRFAKLWKAG